MGSDSDGESNIIVRKFVNMAKAIAMGIHIQHIHHKDPWPRPRLHLSVARLPSERPPIPAAFTLTLIIALLLLSALGTAAAYTIYIYFYSKHDVGKIAPYLFTVPMLSVVFSHLMLGTAVTRVELLGLAPLAAGIYLTSRRM